jgi:predicted TIM-barrel fold metal-dependent hydrolase
MGTIDVHQHLWPESLVRALERRRDPPRLRGSLLELTCGGPFETDLAAHLPERRLELLDRIGVDVAVISPAPTSELDQHADLRDAYDEGIAQLIEAAGGRFLAFAAGRCLPGFAGACVSAEAILAGCEPLQRELEAAGQVLFVHPGPPRGPAPKSAPSWWAPGVDYTSQMQAAYAAWVFRDADRFPRLRVLFAILAGGAPAQLERLESRGVDASTTSRPNAYFDVASYGRRALELALAAVGPRQLVYGSDVPVIDPAPTHAAVLGLGENVVALVCDENPTRLLSPLT